MRSTPNHRNFQRKLARLAAAFLAFAWFPCAALAVDLVPTGASWLYLDDGSDQGSIHEQTRPGLQTRSLDNLL